MIRYVLFRILLIPMIMLGVVTIIFFVLRLSGDPVYLFVSQDATPAEVQIIREELGFNRPLPIQYIQYIRRAAIFDFGRSLRYGEPAIRLLLLRWPATLTLALSALLISILIGLPFGAISALKRGTIWDSISSSLTLIGQGAPVFWIGIMLILIFSVRLRWLPATGSGTLRHLILPSFTLGAFFAARVARITRTSILEVLQQKYIVTAKATGSPKARIFLLHVLKNASISIVTIIGLSIPSLIGGAVMAESVFNWPGIAGFMINAVYNRDYPVVQAGVFIMAFTVAVTNLLVDIIYTYLDPRIKLGNTRG